MFEFQSSLIFPTHAVPPAGPLPPGAAHLSIETADGNRLAGIHIPSDSSAAASELILGFGGNAWNGQDVAEYLHELFPDHDIVAFHYRGYAPSSGSPSAEALIADAPLIYDFAIERLKKSHVIGVGLSIGTGVVAQLANRRRLDGVILVTPFDSLKAVAEGMFSWLPIGRIFDHEIDAAGPLEGSRTPVAIISAERDEVIPTERTDALRRRVGRLVFDRTIPGASHNDIYARSEFQNAMHEALATILRAASA